MKAMLIEYFTEISIWSFSSSEVWYDDHWSACNLDCTVKLPVDLFYVCPNGRYTHPLMEIHCFGSRFNGVLLPASN